MLISVDERKAALAMELLYVLIHILVKLSLFAMYQRLFAEASRSTKCLIAVGSALVALSYLAMFTALLALCVPRPGGDRRSAWQHLHCGQRNGVYYAVTLVNIASNLYMFVLPVRVVWRLQMSMRRRLGICALFLAD
jgi:large subunit ribosomal protein L36e